MVEVSAPERVASTVVDAANKMGLRMFALNPRQIRAVFHLHITEKDVRDGLSRLAQAVNDARHSG